MTDTLAVSSLPSRRALVALAGLGSLALLVAAWLFQWAGFEPCAMCYWQRWPHMAAVALMVLAAGTLPRAAGIAAGLAGLAAVLTSAGIGVYHSGVERGWWEGPASCTGGGTGLAGLSGADLLDPAAAAPIVMCDEIAWQMLGLTMANLNVAASLALGAVWGASVLRAAREA